MKMSTKTRLMLSAISAAAIALSATPTFAQDSDDPTLLTQTSDSDVFSDEDTIVVTGSRIKRRSIDNIFPTNSLGQDVLLDRGFTNVVDALIEIPAFGNGISDFGDQGGTTVGQNFVDFLDLGTARTLVLVDGKRFVNSATPSLGGASGLQVDFNVIPTALIERVDTIGVGGAPIYGSDAIAGTVNVLLRDDYEGLFASTQYSATEQGDADVFNAQIVAGSNFDNGRGNITFSIEHETQQELLEDDRSNINAPVNDFFFTEFAGGNGDDLEDQLALTNNRLINIFTNGGVISPTPTFIGSLGAGAFPVDGLLQFDGSGNLVPFNAGTTIPGQSLFFSQGGDGSNLFQETTQILTPSERTVGTARFNYEFNDRISANADFTFANTNALENVDQGGFQSFAFPGASAPLTFSVNHPLLTTQARNTLIANGVDADTGTFVVNRFNNDIIDSSTRNETNLWRFSGGFEGNFDLGDRQFNWDVSFTHGETDLEQAGEFIVDQSFVNALDAVAITQADIDAAGGIDQINAISGVSISGAGDVVCQSVIDAATGVVTGASGSGITDTDLPFIQGCAPLDVFGFARGSEAALDFVTGPSRLSIDNQSTQFVANLNGSFLDLPAGPLAFNVGYETRRESGAFVPSLANQLPLGRAAATFENSGGFTTDEFYGELSVPIVSPDLNIPLVRDLRAEGAYRNIDVSTLDETIDVFTVGGSYSPIEDIQFVGNYTESTRLPSIAELFTPLAGAFSAAADPCDNRNIDAAPDVALRTANCEAAGLDPTTFVSNVVNATALGATGGNPLLTPEESESFTVGAILTPRFLPNFEAKVDYISVEINDAIAGVSLTQNLQACFDSPNFPNVPECDTFVRDAGGQIVDFTTGQANAATFDTEFLQVQASYFYDVADAFNLIGGIFGSEKTDGDHGALSHNISVFSPLSRDFAVGDEDPALNNTVGGFADPDVSVNFATSYTKDNLRVFWGILWQDNPLVTANPLNTDEFFDIFVEDAGNPPLDENGRIIGDPITKGDGSQFIHNASISYTFADVIGTSDTTLQLTVNNVFDREPSRLENALNDFNATQVFGRSYALRLSTQF